MTLVDDERIADRAATLMWHDGVGYLPFVRPIEYGADYFAEFERRARSRIGQKLMASRIAFVAQYYNGPLLDVGIGCGAFVLDRSMCGEPTFGHDINPVAVMWLRERGLLGDPAVAWRAMSLWDVIEHIEVFDPLLTHVTEWLFVATPIYRDRAHAVRSKHFKPDEHCWYFTRDGLVREMKRQGFVLHGEDDGETRLGREDIGRFAFRRR